VGRTLGVRRASRCRAPPSSPAAHLVSTTLPAANGYVESRIYDRAGRLTEVKNQKAAGVLSRSTYALDPVGNRLTMQTTTATVTYTYDALDRLTQACYTVGCAAPGDNFRRYTYDPVGNRLTEVRDTGTTTATYDAADQLSGTSGPGGAVSYTYDLDGRQTAAGSRSFSWAQPDRLASTTAAGTTTTYTYDGDGLRTLASTGTQANKKTQFDWDPNAGLAQVVAERDGNAALVRRYRQGLAAVSMDSGGSTFYFAYDGLGSVVNLTNASGVTQWTYAYLPYGGVRTETKNATQAPANVLRFTGEVLDPTGLYQLRARSYDPATGRFISTDPAASDPGWTTYAYARSDPVRLTDPSGQCAQVLAAALVFSEFGPADVPAYLGAACILFTAVLLWDAAKASGSLASTITVPLQTEPLIDNQLDFGIMSTGGGGDACQRLHLSSTKCKLLAGTIGGLVVWGALQPKNVHASTGFRRMGRTPK
jgi:RHS repeat-associated protein